MADPAHGCGSCVYFEPIILFESTEDDATAEPETICRRYPPTDGWPIVLTDDWCGEWKAMADMGGMR